MFNKILIANRGEIAIRIMRACRELGIKTVAVYSEADRSALHAQIADEAVCIGPAPSKDSYLNTKSILAACEITHADAVHPGFGFLSENPHFARLCEKCNITFIGPSPDCMNEMGDKAHARETMIRAGVPVIPGSDGIVPDITEAKKVCRKIGYPVMVKATAGGGGRGIRMVESEDELEEKFAEAQSEALSCFGNGDLYIEKFLVNPRHIEIQLLADNYGNVVHHGERDCSLQRRNQKVLEESPSPVMTEELRSKMGAAAVRAAKACGYKNAGTIEFLVDKSLNFYFMEMNTRIQVEHPVTEFVTGIDLVKAQIRIAAGEKLWFSQDDVKLTGHAIECRINAEDPRNNFLPCPGTVRSIHVPGGFNVKGTNREEAIMKMRVALAEFIIDGVDTNIDFHLRLLKNEDFLSGNFDNGFLNRTNIMDG